MKRLTILFASLCMASGLWAKQAMTPAPLNVRTADGTVSNYPYQLKFPNGNVTDNADGTMTISESTTALNGSTILNTSTLQTGATFYVSSGTVKNHLGISGELQAGTTTGISGQLLMTQGANLAPLFSATGKIYQIIVSSVSSSSTTSITASYANSNSSAIITTQAFATTVIVAVYGEIAPPAGTSTAFYTFLRDGVNVVGNANGLVDGNCGIATSACNMPLAMVYVDTSPGLSTTRQYIAAMKMQAGTGGYGAGGTRVMILMEIGQ